MREPTASIAADEVHIQVHASAVNRADLLQKAGQYRPPPGVTDVLGLECAGVVARVGAAVTHLRPGDRACALLAGGGYGEEVVCPAAHAWPIPDDLPFTVAAALPEALCTVWMALRDVGRLAPGERILLHAGASGIGTTAIQAAKAWGNPVFVTVGSEDKLARCVSLGADGGAIRTAGPWGPAVRAWAPDGVDVIVDPVGAPYLEQDQDALAVGGRVVLIGLMGGRTAPLDLGKLLVKRQTVAGTVLRSRAIDDKARIVAGALRELWPLVLDGRVRPVIDSVVPVARVDEAHAAVASDRTVGKVVLTVRA